MVTSTKNIIEQVNKAFADNNPEGFLEFCDEAVEWTMVGEETRRGKDTIRQWMSSMKTAEAPKFTVQNVIAEGDFVVAHGDMTMKDEKQAVVPYSYCDLYRFRNGKIVELRSWVVKTGAK